MWPSGKRSPRCCIRRSKPKNAKPKPRHGKLKSWHRRQRRNARRMKHVTERAMHVVSRTRQDRPWQRLSGSRRVHVKQKHPLKCMRELLSKEKPRPEVRKQKLRNSKGKFKIGRPRCACGKKRPTGRKRRCVVSSRHSSGC
jgi:hypothetical protein